MALKLNRILVVGGGTAGWIAATCLNECMRRAGAGAEVALLESEAIGIIGTGEGSTPILRRFLDEFIGDEDSFLRETGATFKLSVLFQGWQKDKVYTNPFESVNFDGLPPGSPVHFDYLRAACVARGEDLGLALGFHPHLLRQNKAPMLQKGNEVERLGTYSYHFDGHSVGAWLSKRAQAEGVKRIEGKVVEVRKDESGNVASLVLEDGRIETADFFVDCSGFRRLLVGEAMGEPWIDYTPFLPVNSAIPFPVKRKDTDPIRSYTGATAMKAGWMWEIPLQHRISQGYVFCDAFTTAEEAQKEVEALLGHEIEPVRHIRFTTGRLRNMWVRNCVAIGLSSNFTEPLEATSIVFSFAQSVSLSSVLVEGLSDDSPVKRKYNAQIAEVCDGIRDFIALHYRTPRNDTPFWQAVNAEIKVPDSLAEKMDLWRQRMPQPGDEWAHMQIFGHAQDFYVGQGVGVLSPEVAQREMDFHGAWPLAEQILGQIKGAVPQMTGQAMDHRAYLERVNQAG
ncbi:MAG: tryptophan 7-halogenase [Alphaproteobacteria bacterium]